jgi:hypothetical protein
VLLSLRKNTVEETIAAPPFSPKQSHHAKALSKSWKQDNFWAGRPPYVPYSATFSSKIPIVAGLGLQKAN